MSASWVLRRSAGSAAIIVSMPPVTEAWAVGWQGLGLAALMLVITIAAAIFLRRRYSGHGRNILTAAILIAGYFAIRYFADPATDAIEAVNPTSQGYLGGMGLPVMLSWIVGGLFAAAAAYLIGRVTLGLRSDYLAIATLGISEIILSVLKNENWLTRGVKNVTDIPRPVPDELDLQRSEWFANLAVQLDMPVSVLSSIAVRGAFAVIFIIVLVLIMILCERALNSPWGRMMRAIRDNRDSAAAMGKDITGRHLQVFVLGSAVVGIAGANAGNARRPVHAHHLYPAALHLPDLGDGDRRGIGQQFRCGAGRLRDLVRLDPGRAGRPVADAHHHRHLHLRPGHAIAPRRQRAASAHALDGRDPAHRDALLPARADPREIGGETPALIARLTRQSDPAGPRSCSTPHPRRALTPLSLRGEGLGVMGASEQSEAVMKRADVIDVGDRRGNPARRAEGRGS